MKRMIFGAAFVGTVLGTSLGTGTASADVTQVEGNYATLAACQADGPHVQITEDNGAYSHWSCEQGEDGLYYLYLST
ncbi:MAG: hypothetical protein KDB71_09150 [Mycobacterium sp.]|nr:hypothetical protein [Mycobacterium sp.]